MAKRGQFISIEGVEGVGKSTNLAFIQSLLDSSGIEYILTREPGGTPVAEKVRDILLDKSNTEMTEKAELMLVFAARAQHVETLIKPAIEAGKWVISDRFTDSTYAYQGAGRQMSAELIHELELFSIGEYRPDKTLLLDLPTEIGLERAGQRGALDRFESESQLFFQRVREGFLMRAAESPDRVSVIDASHPIEDVQAEIEVELKPLITRWRDS